MAINGFKCADTEQLFNDGFVRRFSAIAKPARMKLLSLDIAEVVDDLRSPPGNRLEALKGDRKGQYSIRINKQWRVCFEWEAGGAWEVEIVDYH